MIKIEQAQEFLNNHYLESVTATYLGEGAWSRCFGYQVNGRNLVIRFGKHVTDFKADQLAHQFTAPGLPIPEVLEIGETADQYYAISERAFGVPLESVTAEQWRALVPAVADMLEAMRNTKLPKGQGAGELHDLGKPPTESWSQRLLSAGAETEDVRSHGSLNKLANSSIGLDLFDRSRTLLEKVVTDDIPITITHRDLINRNAFVDGTKMSGVFDWGCSLLGDSLYDLAWFEFWQPWLPHLNIDMLKAELKKRWEATDSEPQHYQERMLANHLHIGLDHLLYNASVGDEVNLVGTAERMIALIPELGK